MGRLCGERGTAQALRAPAGRKKRVSPHPAPKHPEAPRSAPNHPKAPRVPAPAAAGASPLPPPAPWVRAHPAPSPSLPRIYPRIYVPLPGRFGCPAARVRSCRSRRAPAPATSSLSQPTAARPAPSPSLPRIYPGIYVPLPGRFGCPAARVRSCRSRRAPAPAASSRPPRTFAAPSPSLPLIYPRIYIPLPRQVRMPRRACPLLPQQACPALSPSEGGKREAPPSPAGKPQPAPTFSAAPTSAQPPVSSRSRSPWHTAPRRWCGCHGRDTAAGRARFGRGRIRSG